MQIRLSHCKYNFSDVLLKKIYLIIIAIVCETYSLVSIAKTIKGEQSTLVTVSANVQAIDYETREVTLVVDLGNVVSFVADERIKRFNEFRVGNEVIVDHYVSITAELRAPTELETLSPFVEIVGSGITPGGATPVGSILRALKVVAVIIGLDLPTQSVSLLGPRGNIDSNAAQNSSNLRAL